MEAFKETLSVLFLRGRRERETHTRHRFKVSFSYSKVIFIVQFKKSPSFWNFGKKEILPQIQKPTRGETVRACVPVVKNQRCLKCKDSLRSLKFMQRIKKNCCKMIRLKSEFFQKNLPKCHRTSILLVEGVYFLMSGFFMIFKDFMIWWEVVCFFIYFPELL